jgi:hypothetical protein
MYVSLTYGKKSIEYFALRCMRYSIELTDKTLQYTTVPSQKIKRRSKMLICARFRYAAGRWFSPGNLVSSINKSDHHDITEILLKVSLNTITRL